MAKTEDRGLPPYVYRKNCGYWAQVWNAELRKLIYLGTFQTIAAAQARVARAQELIGAQPGKRKQRVACKWGHPLIGENVRFYYSWGQRARGCRRCRLDQEREGRERKKIKEADLLTKTQGGLCHFLSR